MNEGARGGTVPSANLLSFILLKREKRGGEGEGRGKGR